MADTIQIMSKKAFRFPRPDVNPQDNQELKFGEMYFDTTPNEIQVAPAWIQKDPMFEWASADGDIVVVQTVATSSGATERSRSKPGEGRPGEPNPSARP